MGSVYSNSNDPSCEEIHDRSEIDDLSLKREMGKTCYPDMIGIGWILRQEQVRKRYLYFLGFLPPFSSSAIGFDAKKLQDSFNRFVIAFEFQCYS